METKLCRGVEEGRTRTYHYLYSLYLIPSMSCLTELSECKQKGLIIVASRPSLDHSADGTWNSIARLLDMSPVGMESGLGITVDC
jgi:hypothetical protein